MARLDPTLISFRLPRDVVRDIASRADCPPPAGPDRVGGVSLWVRQLVLKELGLDPGAQTDQARERAVDEFLLAVAAFWRIRRTVTELQAETDKKARTWLSKMTRAEKQLAAAEHHLEQFGRAAGHELGCDCADCQDAAASGQRI